MSVTPYWSDGQVELHLGDCLVVMREMPDASVDAIVTDPPAGIGFMNREWDDFRRARNPADAGRDNVFGRTSSRGPEYGRSDRDAFVSWLSERMAEAMRVLKPGAHALVWSIPRTAHWTAWALEDAGFEVRDCIPHLFGSGFPKSLDLSKAIDAAAGKLAEREVTGPSTRHSGTSTAFPKRPGETTPEESGRTTPQDYVRAVKTAPATEEAARWEGWGTALKPGQEMWWLARKPIRGTVAANVLEHGTGALNIGACKVATAEDTSRRQGRDFRGDHRGVPWSGSESHPVTGGDANGRWPPNLLLTHSASCEVTGYRQIRGDSRSGQEPGERQGGFADVGADRGSTRPNGTLHGDQMAEVFDCAPDCPVGELDRQSGNVKAGGSAHGMTPASGTTGAGIGPGSIPMARTRNFDSYGDSGGASRFFPVFRYQAKAPSAERPRLPDGTAHETVKSRALMQWLCRLITPPGGTVLDLFAGSGPTAEACIIEGFKCVLIERERPSAELIRTRLRKDIQPAMFGETP